MHWKPIVPSRILATIRGKKSPIHNLPRLLIPDRILHQKEWAYPPEAQNTDYVEGLKDVRWRKGYGEDEDAVEVLEAKGLNKNS